MNFGMSLLFIRTCKFSSTRITSEWLFTCMCSYMSGEMVRPTERPQTYSALEWLLACMYSDMSGEFVTAGKPAIALIDGTSVWSLVDWSLTRSVGILPRPHGHQSDREAALLEHLSQDLVTLGRALVVVRHRGRAGGRP